MKKLIILLAFIALPLVAVAQNETASTSELTTVENMIEKTDAVKETNTAATSNSTFKNQIIYLNRKKSSDIISIKAYRKSLQIKVKTIKLC